MRRGMGIGHGDVSILRQTDRHSSFSPPGYQVQAKGRISDARFFGTSHMGTFFRIIVSRKERHVELDFK